MGAAERAVAVAGQRHLRGVGDLGEEWRGGGPEGLGLLCPVGVGRVGAGGPEERGLGCGVAGKAADGEDADHLACGAIALAELGQGQVGRGPVDGGPERAIGEGSGDERRQGAVGAHGVDDDVSGGSPVAVDEEVGAVAACHLRAGLDGDRTGLRRLPEQAVERGAVDAEALRRGVGHIKDGAADRVFAIEAGEGLAEGHGLIVEAEGGEDVLPDGLNDKAGAHGAGFGKAVVERDAVAVVREEACGGEATDARTCDRDGEAFAHFTLPLPAPISPPSCR